MGQGDFHSMSPVVDDKFALLDLVLCENSRLSDAAFVESCRQAVLATDHFLVIWELSKIVRTSWKYLVSDRTKIRLELREALKIGSRDFGPYRIPGSGVSQVPPL